MADKPVTLTPATTSGAFSERTFFAVPPGLHTEADAGTARVLITFDTINTSKAFNAPVPDVSGALVARLSFYDASTSPLGAPSQPFPLAPAMVAPQSYGTATQAAVVATMPANTRGVVIESIDGSGLVFDGADTSDRSSSLSVLYKRIIMDSGTGSPQLIIEGGPHTNQLTEEERALIVELVDEVVLADGGGFGAADRLKLNGIAAGAEVNVQPNWNEADANDDAFVRNKPDLAGMVAAIDRSIADNARLIGRLGDLQSVSVATASSYNNTLNSQLGSERPLILVMAAAISGNRPPEHGGAAFNWPEGQVLYYAPTSQSAEALFVIGQGGGGGTDLPAYNQAETEVLHSRAGSLFWEEINEVPDTPGTSSAHGHVLTVFGDNDRDYRWQEAPSGGDGEGTGLTPTQAARLAGITVNNETAAREAADNALGVRITGEATNRGAADDAIRRRTQRLHPVSTWLRTGDARTLYLEWKPLAAAGTTSTNASVTTNALSLIHI